MSQYEKQFHNKKVKCFLCGKGFAPLYESWRNYKRGKSKALYCSKKCYFKSRIGIERPDVAQRNIGNKWRVGLSPGNAYHVVNEDFFKEISNEKSAYWFGYLLADGCMKYNSTTGYLVGLTSIDKEHLEQFRRDIDGDHIIRESNANRKPCYNFGISNKIFATHLFEKGMVPNKTKILTFPICIPDEYMNHFIRGYWDGDGSYFVKGREFQAGVVGTFSFISELAKVLQQRCNLRTIRVDCHSNELHMFRKTKFQAKKICNFLYENYTLCLERKHKKFLAYLNTLEGGQPIAV